MEDEQGNSIAHQWTQASTVVGDRIRLVFRAPVPAFGYRQFRVRAVKPTELQASPVQATEKGLENEHLRAAFANDGTLSIYDKEGGGEVFRNGTGGGRAVVIDDPSDTWSHNIRAYTKEIGAFGNGRVRVLEQGPLRATVRVRTTYGAFSLQADWILYGGARTLEARVTAKYGYSAQGSDMRISIVRGAVYAQHDPRKLEPNGEYLWQDQGEQTFRLLLVPHRR